MVESTKSDNDPQKSSQATKLDGFWERLHRSLNGRTLKWLSDETGISTSMLSAYGQGKTPGSDKALAIAKALDVDLVWLLVGATGAPAPGQLLERHPPWSPHHHSRASNLEDVRQQAAIDADTVFVDYIDLQYGLGGTYLDDAVESRKRPFPLDWIRLFTHAPAEMLFWAEGFGDSMEPTIRSGEPVLIDRSQREPRMGDGIWACAYGEVGMIKRLRPLPNGTVEIHSDNQFVPSAFAADGELHVIGRVVAVVRKL